jgi:hypothetical protein
LRLHDDHLLHKHLLSHPPSKLFLCASGLRFDVIPTDMILDARLFFFIIFFICCDGSILGTSWQLRRSIRKRNNRNVLLPLLRVADYNQSFTPSNPKGFPVKLIEQLTVDLFIP